MSLGPLGDVWRGGEGGMHTPPHYPLETPMYSGGGGYDETGTLTLVEVKKEVEEQEAEEEGRGRRRKRKRDLSFPPSPVRTPRRRTPAQKTLVCGVCGDGASGVHYGVASCEGCKGFFKRIVRSEQITPGSKVCSTGGNCPISRDNRKDCRYCRFQKCCRIGMQAEMVVGNKITRSIADAIREAGGVINDDQEEEEDLKFQLKQETPPRLSPMASLSNYPVAGPSGNGLHFKSDDDTKFSNNVFYPTNENGNGQHDDDAKIVDSKLKVKRTLVRLSWMPYVKSLRDFKLQQKKQGEHTWSPAPVGQNSDERPEILLTSKIWMHPNNLVDFNSLVSFASYYSDVIYKDVFITPKDFNCIQKLTTVLLVETLDSTLRLPFVSSLRSDLKHHILKLYWPQLYVLKWIETGAKLTIKQAISNSVRSGAKDWYPDPNDFIKNITSATELIASVYKDLYYLRQSAIEMLLMKLMVIFTKDTFAGNEMDALGEVENIIVTLRRYIINYRCRGSDYSFAKMNMNIQHVSNTLANLRRVTEQDVRVLFFPTSFGLLNDIIFQCWEDAVDSDST